jgi:hypothetical protein
MDLSETDIRVSQINPAALAERIGSCGYAPMHLRGLFADYYAPFIHSEDLLLRITIQFTI